MSAVAAVLGSSHRVRVIDSTDAASLGLMIDLELRQPADLYLLRSHVPEVVAMIQRLEHAGAQVVNRSRPTALCSDRFALDGLLGAAGLPLPRSWCAAALGEAAAGAVGAVLPFPLVVKSRWSRRGDLVRKVRSRADLVNLAAENPGEAVILQEFIVGDSLDRKLYVVDELVLAVECDSPLTAGGRGARRQVEVEPEWSRLALATGRALGLRVFGVDLVLSERGPRVVDVNAFPGFRGVPQAPEVLARMVERTGTELEVTA